MLVVIFLSINNIFTAYFLCQTMSTVFPISESSVGDFSFDHAAIRWQLDFSHPSTSIDKCVSYRRYHRIDIDQFRNDLNNIPFVRSPEGTAAELYDQYITGVTQVLDKHAPIISRKAKQQSDEWLSDSYRMARSLRWQFERRWRKLKSELNRSRLRRQIAWCNRLANKDKGSDYTNLITANSRDPKKLWQSLRKVLHRTSETVLPAHSSDKSVADMFASFFSNKISKIRYTFSTSGSFTNAPDSVPPTFNAFMPVTEEEVYKCISESPTKSCSLDPIPTQCSLSSAISRVCTHSGASCRKMNSPTRLCCRYPAKHSKRTEEIRLLSEVTTHIFPHRSRNRLEKQFILFYISS